MSTSVQNTRGFGGTGLTAPNSLLYFCFSLFHDNLVALLARAEHSADSRFYSITCYSQCMFRGRKLLRGSELFEGGV